MTEIISLAQGTEEWLAFRRTHIGSSDAACLLGCGFHTPRQLWDIKKGIKEVYISPAMQRGTELESAARACYEEKTCEVMFPLVGVSTEKHFMLSSLDGINLQRTKAVEIKCPGDAAHKEFLWTGRIAEKYNIQCHHHMYVWGLPSIDYFSFNGIDGEILTIIRDDDLIEKIIEKEEHFYVNHLMSNIPPEQTKIFKEREDEEFLSVASRLRLVRFDLKKLTEEEETLKERLIELSGDEPCVGGGVKVDVATRKGSVNYKRIPELKGVDLEPYRGESIVVRSVNVE